MSDIQPHPAVALTFGRLELWRRHRPKRAGWRRSGQCRCGALLTQCPYRVAA